MNRIELDNPDWVRAGKSRVRGYAHLDGRFCTGADLATALDATATDSAWIETVGRLNGCFAIITERDGRTLAAVDPLRSIPLFYAVDKLDIRLSDSAYRVLPAGPGTIDRVAAAEFCLTGYVTGRETLCAGVFQLEAGELVLVDPSRPIAFERHRYHRFRHADFMTSGVVDLIAALENVHADVFRRLAEGIRGRTIVVPLSGGYDSRLIGVSLRDMGIRDVICYSYGVPGNWESRTSQELARYLGFRWEFVPYSAEHWRACTATDQFAEYFHVAGNLTSVPHIQDWPAVLTLQREARIPPDSVFVPGHSGDFLAGSHIPKSFARRATVTRRDCSIRCSARTIPYGTGRRRRNRSFETSLTGGSSRSWGKSATARPKRRRTPSNAGTCRSGRASSSAIRCGPTRASATSGGCRSSTGS
jgi:Asparagine synthase (glutamine-hydrolyzing)